ncbi:MAG: hypothetical protein ACRDAX_04515 [Propionibacteriaceae bacterium]
MTKVSRFIALPAGIILLLLAAITGYISGCRADNNSPQGLAGSVDFIFLIAGITLVAISVLYEIFVIRKS